MIHNWTRQKQQCWPFAHMDHPARQLCPAGHCIPTLRTSSVKINKMVLSSMWIHLIALTWSIFSGSFRATGIETLDKSLPMFLHSRFQSERPSRSGLGAGSFVLRPVWNFEMNSSLPASRTVDLIVPWKNYFFKTWRTTLSWSVVCSNFAIFADDGPLLGAQTCLGGGFTIG